MHWWKGTLDLTKNRWRTRASVACLCLLSGAHAGSVTSDIIDRHVEQPFTRDSARPFRVVVSYKIQSSIGLDSDELDKQLVGALEKAYPALQNGQWWDGGKPPQDFPKPIRSCRKGECDRVELSLAISDENQLNARIDWHDGAVASNSGDDNHKSPPLQGCDFSNPCQRLVLEQVSEALKKHVLWHMQQAFRANLAAGRQEVRGGL